MILGVRGRVGVRGGEDYYTACIVYIQCVCVCVCVGAHADLDASKHLMQPSHLLIAIVVSGTAGAPFLRWGREHELAQQTE